MLLSCSTQQKISTLSNKTLLKDTALTHAHTGIAVFDVTENKYLYRYNSDKYFVPASNVKLPTLYAGMKLLGEQLPGIKYTVAGDSVFLQPTGDPSFLHPDFKKHPVFDFLKQQEKPLVLLNNNWKTEALGYGWAWDDYLGYYMTERSPMPIYGNLIKWIQQRTVENKNGVSDTSTMIFSDPEISWDVKFAEGKARSFNVTRPRTENNYTITEGKELKRELETPFVTNGLQTTIELLKDTLHKELTGSQRLLANVQIIYSQPADSLFKPMMHRSDNFFAEQTLLMASNELLGEMNEQKLIDTLLKTWLKDFPQSPKWVDGSGLSRYNLFTPEDFVWLLSKMKTEFGMDRLKIILPTGNEGTLRNYYKDEAGFLFAKTGTLSGHVALSGFLYTRKNKLLVFSILINNHYTSSTAVRRAAESFLRQLRNRY